MSVNRCAGCSNRQAHGVNFRNFPTDKGKYDMAASAHTNNTISFAYDQEQLLLLMMKDLKIVHPRWNESLLSCVSGVSLKCRRVVNVMQHMCMKWQIRGFMCSDSESKNQILQGRQSHSNIFHVCLQLHVRKSVVAHCVGRQDANNFCV